MSSSEEELGHGDIEAELETRRELGLRYDAELVDGFAERIERAVQRRAAEQREVEQRRLRALAGANVRQFVLGLLSLAAFIPLGIVLGLNGHLVALLLSLGSVVAVNVAHAWQTRS